MYDLSQQYCFAGAKNLQVPMANNK